MAQVVFKDLDKTRIRFQAMMHAVGEKEATLAFARAMNHEGRKSFTQVKRTLSKQTGIRVGDIAKATSFHPASKRTLRTVIKGTGAPIPLRYFGAKQFKFGVRARPWGRWQKFEGAFIVRSLGGTVFKNTGGFNNKSRRNNAIEKLWGPSIPREMLRGEVIAAFTRNADDVADRAMHELTRILH